MKHIKNILSALIALEMILTLAACAGGVQRQIHAAQDLSDRAERLSARLYDPAAGQRYPAF